MKFSDVIKTLCVCGCVFGSMCDDVRGMESSEREVFLSLSSKLRNFFVQLTDEEKALLKLDTNEESVVLPDGFEYNKKEKLFMVKNTHICCASIPDLNDPSISTLIVENCTFEDMNSFMYLVGSFCNSLESVAVRNCGLVANDVLGILRGLNPYVGISLDLSCNKLGEIEGEFEEILQRHVFGTFCFDPFNLSDNGFSDDFKERMLPCYGSIIF